MPLTIDAAGHAGREAAREFARHLDPDHAPFAAAADVLRSVPAFPPHMDPRHARPHSIRFRRMLAARMFGVSAEAVVRALRRGEVPRRQFTADLVEYVNADDRQQQQQQQTFTAPQLDHALVVLLRAVEADEAEYLRTLNEAFAVNARLRAFLLAVRRDQHGVERLVLAPIVDPELYWEIGTVGLVQYRKRQVPGHGDVEQINRDRAREIAHRRRQHPPSSSSSSNAAAADRTWSGAASHWR